MIGACTARVREDKRGGAIFKALCGALLAVGVGVGPATAVTPPESSQRFLAPAMVYTAAAPDVSQFQPALQVADYRPVPRLSGFRNRSLSVLKYDTPLQFGQNDLIFKFRAPGARRTIVHFEFLFY